MSVAHLCQVTGASEAAIRRDLNELARRGQAEQGPRRRPALGGGGGKEHQDHAPMDLTFEDFNMPEEFRLLLGMLP